MRTIILADVGIPMIFVHWPLMFAALVLVIGIEVLVIRRFLPLSSSQALAGIGKANLYSTAAGVPMAWGYMFVIQLLIQLPLGLASVAFHWDSPILQAVAVVAGAAWEGGPVQGHLHWIIPLAITVLLVPSFFVSVRLERRSCLQSWPSLDPSAVGRAVYVANLWSYAILFVMAFGWISYQLYSQPGKASNPAMQRTAGRAAFPLSMTSTLNQQPRSASPTGADLVSR